MRSTFCLTLTVFIGACSVHADVSLPPVFSDHAVLQRGVPIAVWGAAEMGERVEISFAGQTVRTVADDHGEWRITLPPIAASKQPQTMTIVGAEHTVTVSDVLVGEVWLCSGQSNMEWPLRATLNSEQFAADAKFDHIRTFKIPHINEARPQESAPGEWVVCSPQTAPNFSAVAFHFGCMLHEALDVPIGLVDSSWGGSTVEAWIPMETLEELTAARHLVEPYRQYVRDMQMDASYFAGADVDDSTWEQCMLPDTFENLGHNIDGVIWFRHEVEIPSAWDSSALTLTLGAIDDQDVTYFNGQQVGATSNWQQSRTYTIDKEHVRAGRAVIAVRAHDTGGAGGFTGPATSMRLVANGGDDAIDLSGRWTLKVASTAPAIAAQHRPSELYNGMIHPIRASRFAGAIWYQGESNAHGERGDEYYTLFPAMIKAWRDRLHDDDMPFYFVQLPLFTNDEPNTVWRYPVVRDAQLRAMKTVPNTGMAITLELGDANDIHPRNKHDVADRLARWALADVYETGGIVKCGPVFESVRRVEDALEVSFGLFGSSLAARRGTENLIDPRAAPSGPVEVSGFEIAGPDGVFHPAAAAIDADGQTIVISADNVAEPMAARYAWRNNTEGCNLFNTHGLPASPFHAEVKE